jgi:hypothetical protein
VVWGGYRPVSPGSTLLAVAAAGGRGPFGLVDCIFFRLASMCPMAVASRSGRYLRKVCSVRPGRGGRYPLWRAVSNVDMAGEKSAACWNATRSAGWLEFPMTARATIALSALVLVIGACHSPPLAGHLIGCRPGHWMVAASFSNRAVQPAFVRVDTLMRLCSSLSNVCATDASGGIPCRGIAPVWVDWMVCWLATWTVAGRQVGFLS